MAKQTHPLLILFGEEFTRKTRQCVSCNLCRQFCPVFPQLFALLRQDGRSTEPAGAEAYARLLDECWLCGRCELRCPGDLGISRQVVRIRLKDGSAYSKNGRAHPEDRLLSRPQLVGRLGSLVAPLANALVGNQTIRRLSERFTGVDRRATPPRFQWGTFRSWLATRKFSRGAGEQGSRGAEENSPPHPVRLRSRRSLTPSPPHNRRVAYFTGCHVNYYGRSVGQAAVEVLERNGVAVTCPDFRCCGMPQLAAGDGARAEANARFNIERFSALVESGYEIITTCATCSLALKRHYPEFWPSAASASLAEHTWDVFSYLKSLHDAGEFDMDLRPLAQSVRYHYPCHARYQRYGNNVTDLLRLIPELKIDYAAMACCGMGGTHGFKRRHYRQSQQQAAETCTFLQRANPDCVVSDCPMCVHRIGEGSGLETLHPIELLRKAYS